MTLSCQRVKRALRASGTKSENWWRRLQASSLISLLYRRDSWLQYMPARGACVSCDNDDIEAAVDYIIKKS